MENNIESKLSSNEIYRLTNIIYSGSVVKTKI